MKKNVNAAILLTIRIYMFVVNNILFSRIMCIVGGSFLTYTFLEEKTASRQISF
ncbi:MAG: hypothetical protein ACFFCM_15460 [Promethearchaeota archaeon]